jgi:hypothetical protein
MAWIVLMAVQKEGERGGGVNLYWVLWWELWRRSRLDAARRGQSKVQGKNEGEISIYYEGFTKASRIYCPLDTTHAYTHKKIRTNM